MIFVNQKKVGQDLKEKLRANGVQAELLMGGIEQGTRDKIIDDFRNNSITSLICTNVLARGIDVPEVDLVVNYDVPYLSNFGFKVPDFANYMHRVGRTGRFGTDGVAVSLYDDETMENMVD